MRAALALLSVALASCGIPVKESFWRPEAPNGYLRNLTTCDIGGSKHLVIPLEGGVSLETRAVTEDDAFVARFWFYGTVKGRLNAPAKLQGKHSSIESPLVLVSSADQVNPQYEVRWAQPGSDSITVSLPALHAGGGESVVIPPIAYKFGPHAVLKCIHF